MLCVTRAVQVVCRVCNNRLPRDARHILEMRMNGRTAVSHAIGAPIFVRPKIYLIQD